RLNVATSRARALVVLVASPELATARCKSPRQMQLVNALCTYLERAETIALPALHEQLSALPAASDRSALSAR
ncbi:MAG TPA: hypothetical protein VNN80_19070, partial [Polyangiaceae bacterium]|nr:hypothetical protein [Polyangiaceae bacterium]